MIQRILAAVDDSPRAPEVVDMADLLAKQLQAEVGILRVINLPPGFPPAAATHPDDLARVLDERARQALAKLIGSRTHLRALPPVLSATEPWSHILEEAARQQADLIVIGSHGYRGWDHLLGTTAARVVNHATCHVFVVHSPPAGTSAT